MQSSRVYGLDENFKIIHEYQYIEFEWDRKYYDPGEFTLYCDASQYNKNVKYIKAEGRDGIGMHQKIEFTSQVGGDFISIQGFFLEKELDYFTTDLGKNFNANSALYSQMRTWCNSNNLGKDCEALTAYTFSDSTGLQIETQVDAHQPLGEALRSVLQGEEMGYTLSQSKKVTFYKGKDKGCTFARELGNVSELTYTDDFSNARDMCKGYIKMEDDATSYDVKSKIDGSKYAMYKYPSDGDSIVSTEFTTDGDDDTTYTLGQLRNQIKAADKIYLLDYMEENSIEIKALQTDDCQYMVDYDLGDKVTVATTALGVTHSARISEISEVWKQNQSEITLTIGNTRRTSF